MSGPSTSMSSHYTPQLQRTLRARVSIVGPLLGGNPGMLPRQGEVLGGLLREAGYSVVMTSHRQQKLQRIADIARTLHVTRNRVDVQCLQVFGGRGFVIEDMASWLGRRYGQRLVFVMHGGRFIEFAHERAAWVRRVLRRADVIVTPSEFLRAGLQSFGFSARVIPNIISLKEYSYRFRQEVRPRLLWMRAFHPIYNPELAVHAFTRIRSRFPDATLTLAGEDKGSEPKLRQLVERLKLTSYVRFAGFLDSEAKKREAAAHDIYLNTNRIDNTPVSVIEMAASGLPVVSTNVGGMPYLLRDGYSGLLVPNDDAEALANAVERLVQDPALAARISSGGRAMAEAFDWDRVRPLWDDLFARLVEGRS